MKTIKKTETVLKLEQKKKKTGLIHLERKPRWCIQQNYDIFGQKG